MKNYSAANNIYTTLIKQLHLEILALEEKYSTKEYTTLTLCHVLRQNSCFTWLIEDIASFNQNKVQYVEALLNDCKIILIHNTVYHPGDSKHSIYLKKWIVHLLFTESCPVNFLKHVQQKFCILHDKFELVKDIVNQSLTILGLALINAYEGQSIVFQGLKIAVDMNPLLATLIQAIRFQLPVSMPPTMEEVCLLNPLFNFRTVTSTASYSSPKSG